MTKLIALFVLLVSAALEIHTENLCQNNNNRCICIYGEDYEFQCPEYNYNILVHSMPNQYLKIDCQDMENFNLKLLPNYTAGNNIYVSFRFCPLPEDNFLPILDKFSIKSIYKLDLDNVTGTSLNQTISKNIFYGLTYLRNLTLTNIYSKLDDNLLDYCTNLTNLEINHSEVNDFSSFKFPPSLNILHLTENLISEVPYGIFQNLSKLSHLHLWNNKITHIKKGAFIGLNKLISLELSSNHIKDIEEDSFADLVNLERINLRANKLHEIRSDIFKYNKNLTSIRLEDNPNLVLPDEVFANFSTLSYLKLKNSGIESLPENIFHGSGIETLMLEENRIEKLPDRIFQSLTKLKILNLHRNRLTSLPDNLFLNLKSLEDLNLSDNYISRITAPLFMNTINMKSLILTNNKITTIEMNSFNSLDKLISIDIASNFYKIDYLHEDPFKSCINLERLILRKNFIETFPTYHSLTRLEEMDLSFNRIKKCDISHILQTPYNLSIIRLNNNEIETLDFNNVSYKMDKDIPSQEPIKVDLHNNPLTCNCGNYDLVRYCQGDMDAAVKRRINIQVDGMYCTQPDVYRNILISKIKLEQVSCEIAINGCPTECKSFWRPFESFTVLDCSHRNLTSFPKISEVKNTNIEMNLTGNDIKGGLNPSLGYENVKNLFLSNNKLQELKWIPLGIEKLSLDRNELTHLDPDLLEIMNTTSNLKTLKLSHNPWSCGCSALTLQIFIRDNYKKINSTDVICREDNRPLVEKGELCKASSTVIMLSVLPLLSFLLLTVISLIFYIHYRQEVKIWLFSKNLCLWFISEEELDEDKIYDIFISYSHKDEDFVMQNLLPVLESGPKPFKTCIHIRDWPPGEMIITNVHNSVFNSRRTLVVLSNNFLESVWGVTEFKTAHMNAIQDGRARVIVVKYGDIDESKLGDELRAYLNTNTYVEWGKSWFWNKLLYNLPHSHKRGFYQSNQKHAKVMLKIDDKFELTSPPLTHPESTPPVSVTLPTLFTNHPLNVNEEKNRSSESSLVINI